MKIKKGYCILWTGCNNKAYWIEFYNEKKGFIIKRTQ